MSTTGLPPCGLYKTLAAIGEIPAGRLVYFHNHGDPGPGVYFPASWSHNRATFSERGSTLPTHFDVRALRPLPAEGFYRVAKQFVCCAKKCATFEPDMLVQLGYNGAGQALVFIPELAGGTIGVPDRGTPVDDTALGNLTLLKLPERKVDPTIALPRGILVH
ncbi:MAG TPA: hypothetical protein VGM88_34000 [Kofleriaceae bacterium]